MFILKYIKSLIKKTIKKQLLYS